MKLGSKMTGESRAKMSAAARGIPKSAEHKANIAAARRRRFADPAERAKLSAAQRRHYKENPVSAETRAKIASANRRRFEDPAEREKISATKIAAAKSAAQRGEHGHNWKGDDAGYVAHHKRHGKALPDACAHADDTCQGRLEVAFNHDTPAEFVRVDTLSGCRYSPRVEDYMRLCHSHHVRYDNNQEMAVIV